MLQGAALRILVLFIDADVLSFAELCKRAGYGTDLGGYYLRQLLREKYIQKTERGRYALTAKGKQQFLANSARSFMLRPRMAVLLIAQQSNEFIVLRRTVQPFIDVVEWPAYSVAPGAPLAEAAATVLKERLGIVGQPAYVGTFRRIDMFENEVFDDKLFAMHTFTIFQGAAIKAVAATGIPTRISSDALHLTKHPSKSLFDVLDFVTEGNDPERFTERIYHLNAADLGI
jgi:hypothetical protein